MTTTRKRSQPEAFDATPAVSQETIPLASPVHERNPGMPLDMDWVSRVRINRSAVERRAATMTRDAR